MNKTLTESSPSPQSSDRGFLNRGTKKPQAARVPESAPSGKDQAEAARAVAEAVAEAKQKEARHSRGQDEGVMNSNLNSG